MPSILILDTKVVIDFRLVAKLLSPALLFFGFVAFIPALFALYNGTTGVSAFIATAVISLTIALICKKIGQKAGQYPSLRVLFLFTTLLWVMVALISAIPFYYQLPDINFCQSIFESCSALSTTGSTVITKLETRPQAIILWRGILQYFGGVGFVGLAVVILPISAMGGMSIFKTESQSFDDSSKFTPHVKTMMLSLFLWYVAELALCSFFYVLGGFDLFTAIVTAMCTVATGGMTTTDASMNGTTPFIQYVTIVFMVISSFPFLLILSTFTGNIKGFFKDQQIRGYVFLNAFVAGIVALTLIYSNDYDMEKAIRVALFNVVAVTSTTGYALEDFTLWNPVASILFLMILAIGGCSGSTSGGIKFFRLQICISMFSTQLKKLIHPHVVSEPRFNGKVIDNSTLSSVITYLVSYIFLGIISAVIASAFGLDLGDSITATISYLSNIGPAMGTTLNPSTSFSNVSEGLCLLFSADMIFGRLEILPVLLCFTRMFYKR